MMMMMIMIFILPLEKSRDTEKIRSTYASEAGAASTS